MRATTLQRFGSLGKSFGAPSAAAAVIGAALLASDTSDTSETAWSPAAACLLPDVLPVAGTLLSYGGSRQLAAGGAVTHSGALNVSGTLSVNSVQPTSGNQFVIGTGTGYNLYWSNSGLYSLNHAQPLGTSSHPWGAVTCGRISTRQSGTGINIETDGLISGDAWASNDYGFVRIQNAVNIGRGLFNRLNAGGYNNGIIVQGSNSTSIGIQFASASQVQGSPLAYLLYTVGSGFSLLGSDAATSMALTCGAITASGAATLPALLFDGRWSSDPTKRVVQIRVDSSGNGEWSLNRSADTNGMVWASASGGFVQVQRDGGFYFSDTANQATGASASVTLTRQSAGVLQIGTTAANAAGSVLLTNLTASGAITASGEATIGSASDTSDTGGVLTVRRWRNPFVHIDANTAQGGMWGLTLRVAGTEKAGLKVDNNSGEVRLNVGSGGYYPTIYSNGVQRMVINTAGNTTFAGAITCGAITASGDITLAASQRLFVSNGATTGNYLLSGATAVFANNSVAQGGWNTNGMYARRLFIDYANADICLARASTSNLGVYAGDGTTPAALTCGAVTASGIVRSDMFRDSGLGDHFLASITRDVSYNYFSLGANGLRLGNTTALMFCPDMNVLGSPDARITRSSVGVLQIGTTSANALGSLLLTNLTASGAIQETPTQSSLNPTTTDIPSGKRKGWYNSTLSEFRDWVNIGGTLLKSAAYT